MVPNAHLPASVLDQLRDLRRRREDKEGFVLMYTICASQIEDYERSFAPVLGREKTITDMIKDIREPVVIDLMAPTDTVRSLFKEAKVHGGIGIAVNYCDLRYVRRSKAGDCDIVDIAGDIATRRTWREIESALEGRRADLIMERAILGMSNVPRHTEFYAAMLGRAWRILEPNGGTLLIETPTIEAMKQAGISVEDLKQWEGVLERVRIGAVIREGEWSIRWYMRLTRRPDSPDELPQLKSGD
jgi:hypothetical protein